MKFGALPIKQAQGTVLAHSVPVKQGRLRKGQLLSARDIAALAEADVLQVVVAQPDPDDLGEDTAAARLSQALAGSGLRCSAAATGRVNVFATGPGILRIDADAIHAFNGINPMITVASLPPLARVDTGMMVATVKIISYAVPLADVDRACAAGKAALALLTPALTTAALIETQIGALPSEKGRQALITRLDRLGLTLGPRVIVPHRDAELARAISGVSEDLICVLTASATSDIADVGPAALRAAGGTVTQFGMPVDPGNLIFLGHLGKKPVIGLPGCARSPVLNGADWVLERVICGVPPTPADFARMGVGGLLKEIPTRPKPRGDI